MREVPECLQRRYKALDELVAELILLLSNDETDVLDSNEAVVKLMCELWNILKENPDCRLPPEIQERVDFAMRNNLNFQNHRYSCFMAGKDNCCSNTNKTNKQAERACCSTPIAGSEGLPLSKVLCNLKEAISFDQKCTSRINELNETQKRLRDQITQLESREKEGAALLKQADCMWSCMEDGYKKKLAESQEAQNGLLKQMKEIETSNSKWRKNKKDLEFQLRNVDKCSQEIKEKINEKTNDLKCIQIEMANLKKRLENNKFETAAVEKSFAKKAAASQAKVTGLQNEVYAMRKVVIEEQKNKAGKESEGNQYIKEAREDLQKIYRVFLEKKLENEDLRAEKQALLQEIELLHTTSEQCKDKCKNNNQNIIDEIGKVDAEIAGYKIRCIRCHQCSDTSDVRKFCIDCPRCDEERECLYKEGQCTPDVSMDCVCMATKQKFMDNVFDNMYTVLERQIKSSAGKAVADAIVNCLKRSRNGKLNEETKNLLQRFVLSTVKKNLTLTMIGGAVKTRCEMDLETYNQLMMCLKQVKVKQPPKEDKGTIPKKEPCRRWGGTNECNCPKGPKSCICSKKAPPPPSEPTECPPQAPQEKEDAGEVALCPHKESTACGPDCGMKAVPSAAGTDVAAWKRAPCDQKHCKFSTNMRAAQCVLGPDSLISSSNMNAISLKVPIVPNISILNLRDNKFPCDCDVESIKPCTSKKESISYPRAKMIEEVMGRYVDVEPIEKVTRSDLNASLNTRRSNDRCDLQDKVLKINSSESTKPQLGVRYSYCVIKVEDQEDLVSYPQCQENVISVIRIDKKESMRENYSPGNIKIIQDTSNNVINDNITINLSKNKSGNNIAEDDKNVLLKISDLNLNKNNKLSLVQKHNIEKSVTRVANIIVNNTIADIIKNVRISKNHIHNTNSSEWISVKNFLNKFCCRSQNDESKASDNEIELKNEVFSFLDDKRKISKSQKSIPLYINSSNEKIVANNDYDTKHLNTGVETINRKKSSVPVKSKPKSQKCSKCHRKSFEGDPSKTKVKDSKENNTGNTIIYSDGYSEDNITDDFLTVKINRNCNSNAQVSKLTSLSSGTMVMELDENIVKQIEKKLTLENKRRISVKLYKTASGSCVVDLNPNKNCPKTCVFFIKKSLSGGLILEVDKKTLALLKTDSVVKNVSLQSETMSIILENEDLFCPNKNVCERNTKISKYTWTVKNKSNNSRKIDENNTNINIVKIYLKSNKNSLTNIEALLTRTSSGEEVLLVDKISSLNIDPGKMSSALLTKSSSEKLYLDVKSNEANVVLKETSQGELIISKIDDELISTIKKIKLTDPIKFVKVKVKDSKNNIRSPPAILQVTPSNNFVIIVDKEYEVQFQKAVTAYLDSEIGCPVELTESVSQSMIVDFGNEDSVTNNALIIQSASGMIKIIKKNSNRKFSLDSSSKSLSLKHKILNEQISSMIDGLPHTTSKVCKSLPKVNTKKSSSDSNLYEKSKVNFHNQQNILAEPSTLLKRTPSGQYTIVLNKETKKSFINRLKSYLSNNTHGLIPIKRTRSGEISITLNKDSNQYSSLKITPSGNIYILVDEEYVKDVSKNVSSTPVIEDAPKKSGSVTVDVDKCVTTTCNAIPDNMYCDASKCTCTNLFRTDLNDSVFEGCNTKSLTSLKFCSTEDSEYQLFKSQFKNLKNVSDTSYSKMFIERRDKSPHIVIKPFSGGTSNKRSNGNNQQVFHLKESICSFHRDRYNSVSNELLEISGLCNKAQGIKKNLYSKPKYGVSENALRRKELHSNLSDMDYLDYLPPQLPPFLRDLI